MRIKASTKTEVWASGVVSEVLSIDRLAATINDFISMLLQETGTGKNRSPFVGKVRLVSHQHDDDVTSPFCSYIIDPLSSLLEGVYI